MEITVVGFEGFLRKSGVQLPTAFIMKIGRRETCRNPNETHSTPSHYTLVTKKKNLWQTCTFTGFFWIKVLIHFLTYNSILIFDRILLRMLSLQTNWSYTFSILPICTTFTSSRPFHFVKLFYFWWTSCTLVRVKCDVSMRWLEWKINLILNNDKTVICRLWLIQVSMWFSDDLPCEIKRTIYQ